MNRSRIEYCDHTFNMVTGCLHGCDYCYAEKMVKRFCGDSRANLARTGEYHPVQLNDGREGYVLDKPMRNEKGEIIVYPFGFSPTLHRYRAERLDVLKRGNNIFVGAMADLFGEWVPDEWIQEVFEICEEHPLNNYLFLTKNPLRYPELLKKGLLPMDKNYWYGSTITDGETPFFADPRFNTFVSIEPLLKPFQSRMPPGMVDGLSYIKWIIIGAETGRRKGKVVPEFDWIKNIVRRADTAGVPVFMKNSLISIVGEQNMRREYPEALKKRKLSPKMEEKLYDICNCCGKKMKIRKMVTLQAQSLRNSSPKKYGYMCWECFEEHCNTLDVDIPDIPNPKNGEETV